MKTELQSNLLLMCKRAATEKSINKSMIHIYYEISRTIREKITQN